jgi:hypothetical protein
MNGWKKVLGLLLTLSFSSAFAQTTTVNGTVTDAATGAALPFINVFIPGTSNGVQTDAAGRYQLTFTISKDSVNYAFLGYKTVTRRVKLGQEQIINVQLESTAKQLNEFVVKKKKERYRNKDNPAVELIRQVVAHRDQNRMTHYDYAQYNQYEKMDFSLSNLSDKIKNSKLTRKFKFILDNVDTTKVSGKSLLPMYLEERISDVYYRRNPEKTKTVVTADKQVTFKEYVDNKGLSAYLNHIIQDVDLYDNNLLLFTNQFLSPISDAGPTLYKYYITDTLTMADSTKLVQLEFYPRNKQDLLLEGKLYVTLDGNYAVEKAEITANKDINLNWVQEFHMYFDYEKSKDGRYYMAKNTMMADFGVFKGKSGIYGERVRSIKDLTINQPKPSDFYNGSSFETAAGATERPDSFWNQNRHDSLSTAESKVYANIDSLQKMKQYRRIGEIATLVLAGYKSAGPVEIGPVNTFYSFNPVEGFRLRVGGHTKPSFNKSLYFESYLAYGFKDQQFKYYFGGSYAFNHKSIYEFPIRALHANFQHEMMIPGQALQFINEDNFLLSFKRGDNNRWLYDDIFNLNYEHEFDNHLSFIAGYKYWSQTPAGTLVYKVGNPVTPPITHLVTSELNFQVRWAPHEQFYQGKAYRIPILNRYPIFTLRGNFGVKGLTNGQYNYQSLVLNIYKMVYESTFGWSEVVLEGGTTFGKVPFPLLSIHHANQSYAYQLESYNMMNFLEFVSDHYAGLNIDHNFNGLFFNRVPLLKKLKLREVVAAKILYGGLRNENNPTLHPELIQFNYQNGLPITYTLNSGPYIEGSVGIANIFKLIRVDLVRRFTYLNNPVVSEWGIRTRVAFQF